MVTETSEKTVDVDEGATPSTDTISITLPRSLTVHNSTVGEQVFNLGDFPAESIAFALSYGVTQYLGDGAAVTTHVKDDEGNFVKDDEGNKVPRPKADVDADKLEGVNARVKALMEGVFKTGGGGRALSAFDNELRALVKAVLVRKGIKLADATKASKMPRLAIQGLAAIKAKADKLNKADAEALFAVNWETLTNKAQSLADEHASIDVDL